MKSIKTITITIFLSILVNSAFSQRQFNRKTFGLSDKVIALNEYKYAAREKFGEAIKGELKEEIVYKFNEKGDIIENQFTDKNQGKKIIRTYHYNEKGQIVEANDSESRIIYKSDSKGNVTEEAVYNLDGDLKSKTTYNYDAYNREIEARTNTSGTETKKTFKYDMNGNKIQEILYMGDSKLATASTKYDLKGNPIEEIVDSQAKIIQEFKYTYDEKGNFITKTIFRGSSYGDLKYELAVKEIVERAIEYELSDKEKEKQRIEEAKSIQIEDQRKNEEIAKERLRLEQERIIKEEKEREEMSELLTFLKERKTKYYDIESLSKADFSIIKSDVRRMLYSKIKDFEFDELSIGGVLIVTLDTAKLVTVNTAQLTSNRGEVLKTVTATDLSLTLPIQKIRNYKVNIKASVPIDTKCSKTVVSFKLKKPNEIVYSKNEPSDRIKQLIRRTYKMDSNAQNLGNYTVEYFLGHINDQEYEEVKTIKYKLGAGGFFDYIKN